MSCPRWKIWECRTAGIHRRNLPRHPIFGPRKRSAKSMRRQLRRPEHRPPRVLVMELPMAILQMTKTMMVRHRYTIMSSAWRVACDGCSSRRSARMMSSSWTSLPRSLQRMPSTTLTGLRHPWRKSKRQWGERDRRIFITASRHTISGETSWAEHLRAKQIPLRPRPRVIVRTAA